MAGIVSRCLMALGVCQLAWIGSARAAAITCSPDRWPGISAYFMNESFTTDGDGITLGEMKYVIEDRSVSVYYSGDLLPAAILNVYFKDESAYFVIAYNYKNVTNVDTIFVPSGVVFSYVTKLSYNLVPHSATFYRVCDIE